MEMFTAGITFGSVEAGIHWQERMEAVLTAFRTGDVSAVERLVDPEAPA